MANKKSLFKKYWDFYLIGISLAIFLIIYLIGKIPNIEFFYLLGIIALLAIILLNIGFIGIIIKAIKNRNKRGLRVGIIITIIILQILLILAFTYGTFLGGMF